MLNTKTEPEHLVKQDQLKLSRLSNLTMSSTIDKVLLDSDTNDKFIQEFMSSLANCNNLSRALPKGLDYDYAMSFSEFRQESDDIATQAAGMIQNILKFVNPNSQVSLPDDIADPYFYDQVSETIDALIRHGNSLLSGNSDQLSSVVSKQTMSLNKTRIIEGNVADIPKPQLLFLHQIDNRRNTPFRPKLKTKYHNKNHTPYPEHPIPLTADGEETTGYGVYFPQPYEYELTQLSTSQYITEKPSHIQPKMPDSLRSFQYIDQPNDLVEMIAELAKSSEIAIDLEHHSYRTFLGLTCLMQISNREKDFIVDTLALRGELYQLGEVFANEKIVKVLHGCEQDILWLQRDCALYIVNGFDTYIAAKLLEFPTLSLAHLVKYYCGVALDKKHQLSDWRVRPLSEEMMKYAKLDTHYLLYIYDLIRLDVWKAVGQDGLEEILLVTKKLCSQRYEKPFFQPLGYLTLWKEYKASQQQSTEGEGGANEKYFEMQEHAMNSLWNWRDMKARVEDDSIDYIMSTAELVRLATRLPHTLHEIELCAPLSTYVKQHINEILFLLQEVTSIASTDPAAASGSSEWASSPSRRILSNKRKSDDSLNIAKSIFEFTPAVIPRPSNPIPTFTPSSSHAQGLPEPSPVLDVKDMFKMASWTTPETILPEIERKTTDISRFSLSLTSSIQDSQEWKEESKRRINKSITELLRSINNETKDLDGLIKDLVEKTTQGTGTQASLDSLGSVSMHSSITSLPMMEDNNNEVTVNVVEIDTANNNEVSNSSEAAAAGSSSTFLSAIPQSLEEIYKLASKNRKKNKHNKKRADPSSSTTITDIESTKKQFDYEAYVNDGQDKPVNTSSVDATLEFAKDLGWLPSNEVENVKEEYQKVLACQQSSEDSSNPQQSIDSTASSTNQNQASSLTSGLSKSNPNKVQKNNATANPVSGNSSANYYNYAQMGHAAAVGALPITGEMSTIGNNKSSGKHGGGGGGKSKGKSQKNNLANPYIS